ncbi:MAG: carboxypeptidase-like regulatory domain-containing protein, partial [Bryobacteraceae bacterium]
MNLRRMTLYQWLLAAAIIAAMAALPIRTLAQAISGDLVGTVADASGAGVPNATITATNGATNVKYSGTSSGSGEYRISNLPPGTYTLSASASGFAKSELANVPVQLNQTATANLTLQLGQVATTVNVVEASTVIDTTTAQIQNTFSAKQAQDLPNVSIGAGVLNMSLLSAGVATS